MSLKKRDEVSILITKLCELKKKDEVSVLITLDKDQKKLDQAWNLSFYL